MRIFYVNVIEQNAGWGAECFINKEFLNQGHFTYCVDYRNNRYNLYNLFSKAPDCDVFLLQRGDYFPISLLKSIQIPRFFWASELVSRNRDQDRLLMSHLFDHVFFHTNACKQTAISRGWVDQANSSVLLNGFDPSVFRPMPEVKKDIDVLFTGTVTPRRKTILGELAKDIDIYIPPKKFLTTEEIVVLFNRAKIVLNIHADNFPDTETRIFEVLGSGGFVLAERLSEENPFTAEELVEYSDNADLVKKIRYYLEHEDQRARIAHNGHTAAMNKHTYAVRAKEIADVMASYAGKTQRNSKMIKKDHLFYAYCVNEKFSSILHSMKKIKDATGNLIHNNRG